MFKFLKNIFKEKQIKKEVKLEQLEDWCKEKSKAVLDELNQNIKEKLENIKTNISGLKENINNLEKAEIKDAEKIEPRVKNVVISHRKNYLKVLNQFIRKVDIPEPDYKKALDQIERDECVFMMSNKGLSGGTYEFWASWCDLTKSNPETYEKKRIKIILSLPQFF